MRHCAFLRVLLCKQIRYCIAPRKLSFPIESDIMKYIITHSALQLNNGNSNTDSVVTQLNLLNIGTAQVLTIPGEALPNIGYYLKRNMHTKQPFLFGLTTTHLDMLTKVDFQSFERYE